jgi:hypothetical protein
MPIPLYKLKPMLMANTDDPTGQLGLHAHQHAKILAPKIPQIDRGLEPRG